jgi:hypothetical protein
MSRGDRVETCGSASTDGIDRPERHETENPTLTRLRELEVLEKVVASGKLSVVLSDKGLADRVVNLI